MSFDFQTFIYPFLACVLLVGILGYLGVHVLARKVIFVDLAMAQIAALGATYAYVLGNDPQSPRAYLVSLVFTLAGAAVFALTKTRKDKIPHEATIGLVYAIASAAGILIADRAPHGAEHVKNLLQGSIVWVNGAQVARFAAIVGAVGAFQFVFRKKFLKISLDPEGAAAEGLNVRFWDFAFYLSFGFVITSSVPIAGVLLIFCFLIAPGVAASLFADSVRARVLLGWGAGILVSAVGVQLSYNHAPGPTIMCVFAALLAAAAVLKTVAGASNRPRAAAAAVAAAAVVFLAFRTGNRLLASNQEQKELEEHAPASTPGEFLKQLGSERAPDRRDAAKALARMGHRPAIPELTRLLADKDPEVREASAAALVDLKATEAIPALKKAVSAPEEDDNIPMEMAAALARLGSPDGVDHLLHFAAEGAPRAVRSLALTELKAVLPPEAAVPDDPKKMEATAAWWKANVSAVRFDAQKGVYTAKK